MSSNDEPRPGKPVVGHKVKGRAPIGWRPSPGSAPSAEAAPAARLAPSLTDVAEGFRNDPANDPSIPSNDVRPNGDQIDFRMVRIEEILRHAGMHLLEKCGLAAEWLHHAEAKLSVVLGQHVEKSAGRPEGALTRAARELCVPGKTPEARRKFMERALKIDGIRPEAKSAAQAAGLDNNQSALLAIAHEHSLEAQLAKVDEIAARKAMPRRKSTGRNRGEGTAVESAELPSTVSDRNRVKHDELAAAPKYAVATAAETKGPLTPQPGDDDIPAFLDRRPLSPDDQCAFDGIMAALKTASAVVRERVRAELVRADAGSGSVATAVSGRRQEDDASAIRNQPTEGVVPAYTADAAERTEGQKAEPAEEAPPGVTPDVQQVRPKRRPSKARGFQDDAPF
jgi:hypothetical protein